MTGVGRYLIYNWCVTCNLLHPKNELKCRECGRKIRLKARNSTLKRKFVEY